MGSQDGEAGAESAGGSSGQAEPDQPDRWVTPAAGEPRESRGLLGRLISVFAPADTPPPVSTVPAPVVHGMANLRRLRVEDVAIPKTEIVAVPLTIGKEELVEVFKREGFSRVPVYKGTLDHPQGLVLLKDLALQHGFAAGGRFSLKRLLRPILYVPPSMPLQVLLQKMQKDRVHMALVIDEYGGVDGLATIEDLIETVIGEIEDEHDEDEGALWKEESPGTFIVQSTAPLDDFEQAIGLSLRGGEEDEEIDTLGGLVFLRTGRVPPRGALVRLENGAEFEVIDRDPRRIKRLRLRLPQVVAARDAALQDAADVEAES